MRMNMPTRDELIELYINQNKTDRELANIFKLQINTVRKWRKKYGIVSRTTGPRTKRKKYTKEFLEPYVKESISIAQLCRFIGITPAGGSYRILKKYIKEYELDVSHFKGRRWALGETEETSEPIRKTAEANRRSDEEVLCENSLIYGVPLRKRMISNEIEYRCNLCDLEPFWNGEKLTLHIDHINGESTDNKLENLRFLCPNCHQQTKTWGYKRGKKHNSKKYKKLRLVNEEKPIKFCVDCQKK